MVTISPLSLSELHRPREYAFTVLYQVNFRGFDRIFKDT